MPGDLAQEQRYRQFLEKAGSIDGVKWKHSRRTKKRGNWLQNDTDEEFDSFLPIGSKAAKAGSSRADGFPHGTRSAFQPTAIRLSVSISTPKNLPSVLSKFTRITSMPKSQNIRGRQPADVDNFVDYDDRIKWTHFLKFAIWRVCAGKLQLQISLAKFSAIATALRRWTVDGFLKFTFGRRVVHSRRRLARRPGRP